ncbi:MAG: efflux RND transporter permease subunit [Myxococcales bacterium FL481]|nr:MAG: efflux RND transporter permease subunit [Myxococcales bacterium FL481]
MNRYLRDNGVVHTALSRPITMLMVFASVLVLGAVALLNIRLELIPSGASSPFMWVMVPYNNSTARDVEERITIPLEQELAGISQLKELIGTSSSSDGRINLVFEPDADMDRAYREVRDRVERARAELPDDVDKIFIRKMSSDDFAIGFYGVGWPDGFQDPEVLIERAVVRRLERVPGVAQVEVWGNDQREIRIEVNRSLAEAANLNIFEIAQRLGQSNFNLASGTIVDGDDRFLLRSLASYQDIDELRRVVVGDNDLRLSDVAEVVYDYPEIERRDRYNGRPMWALAIRKESQANTVEVCEAIKAVIEEARADPRMAEFSIDEFFVQGDTILSSLRQVTDAGMQGGVLAFIVLLFFLRRLRLTLVIAGSIPLSIFLALPVMYFSGQSINLVSLIGLMICIGLVVDNSVVVAENIVRYRSRGVSRMAAALHGASEVALPITLATMTTLIVFLPASLMSSGPTQFYLVRMVTPVCVSLVASLFVAIVLIPLAATILFDSNVAENGQTGPLARLDRWWKAKLGNAYEASVGRLNRVYTRVLRASLRRRADVMMVVLLAMGSIAVPANPETGVKMAREQNLGGRQIRINYTVPSHVPLEEADVFVRKVEGWFAEHRKGYGGSGEYINVVEGMVRISVFFDDPEPGAPPLRELGKEIFDELPTPPGWEKRSNFGESDGGSSSTFPVFIYGDDHDTVQTVAEALERRLVDVKGVTTVAAAASDTSRRDELELSLDRTLAERFGVSAGMIANTVSSALRGSMLPRYHAEEREVDVRISYRKPDREQLRDLMQFKVATNAGTMVPLRTLAGAEVERGQSELVRNNKRVAARVNLELDPKDRFATIGRIQKFLDAYETPRGVSFDDQAESREVDEQLQDMVFAMLLGFVFIFLLMGFLFESFVLPLSVVPSIPLSAVGVWWFLFLTGSDIDPLATIGVLLLLGVVVNNGIVLVDFINNARKDGLDRVEAIVQAGTHRFRPILMTALTTVGGMLPLAFSNAPSEGLPYGAFGRTLVGGMTTATVLTLIVVPVCYTFFDDFGHALRRWAERVVKRYGA